MESNNSEYIGTTTWKLTKHMVENEIGQQITNEDFDLFCQHFHNNFFAQFEDTLSYQATDWETVKTWKL